MQVLVNGQPIPFDMKVGDAGEAFFVFETDEDVPEDLITSPLLTPTHSSSQIDVATGKFGAKENDDDADRVRCSQLEVFDSC